ncbi:MAG: hypothetical protein RR909_03185 [Bacilli bacterium]
MASIILSLFLLGSFTLYSTNKQISEANRQFDNNVELLKSRNFSQKSIVTVINNNHYKFKVNILGYKKYQLIMTYKIVIKPFGISLTKNIDNDIYIKN